MKKKTLKTIVAVILIILIILIISMLYLISWAVICGLLKLITLCLHLPFSLRIATGIWLIICLIELVFERRGGVNK